MLKQDYIETVGQLRALLDGLPDDMPLEGSDKGEPFTAFAYLDNEEYMKYNGADDEDIADEFPDGITEKFVIAYL